ncbi:MAG: response regulator [Lachnospiraceae bacterium]|nr:response regulator [Lachnospiraceae bacterium]
MRERKNENFILLLLTAACIGITIVSIFLHWEFWVPPLAIVAIIYLWVVNIREKPDYKTRTALYFIYAVLAIFFHGIHATSIFDIFVLVSFGMVSFSFFDRKIMMDVFISEYVVLLFIQLLYIQEDGFLSNNPLYVSRLVLHVLLCLFIYMLCNKIISDRVEAIEARKRMEERIEFNDADMEDFLSNISHELRTPVNVVNGMSDLMIKRRAGDEAYSIKDAGIRLAFQIEDISDYTECKRNSILLEEEDYMSTSLINDVVTSFRMIDNNDLELVVDMSPSVPTMLKGDIKKLHKIFRHLLENAVKFTKYGGIYVKLSSEKTDYGVNLVIEMEDTGVGMGQSDIESVSEGLYQVNKRRNRSSGGIGLGLFIVYGFAHRMGGFVKIESEKRTGTMVRVTLPQKVSDETPCLALSKDFKGDILFHVRSDKYQVPRVRDFYRYMATNLASGIRVPLYSSETIKDLERLRDKLNVTFIFMGQEEYEENAAYFDELSKGDIVIAVSAHSGFKPNPGSRVMVMPKPLYAYPVVKILNEGRDAKNIEYADSVEKPVFKGVKALIVDDEPMNLVVASSLFSDYEMITETANSGKEAIKKYRAGDYDVVFMDHMMPEMDGVEAMKLIKEAAVEMNRKAIVIALTANVVSGAREMFVREGFDGFIAKPIYTPDFERVMLQVLPEKNELTGGEQA